MARKRRGKKGKGKSRPKPQQQTQQQTQFLPEPNIIDQEDIVVAPPVLTKEQKKRLKRQRQKERKRQDKLLAQDVILGRRSTFDIEQKKLLEIQLQKEKEIKRFEELRKKEELRETPEYKKSKAGQRRAKKQRQKETKKAIKVAGFTKSVGMKELKKYNATTEMFELDLPTGDILENPKYLNKIIKEVVKAKIKELNLSTSDKIRVILLNDNNEGISTGFEKVDKGEFDFLDLIDNTKVSVDLQDYNGKDYLYSIVNSNKLELQIIRAPKFSGFVKGGEISKRSVITIKNDDDLCLGRCLVVALAIRDNHPQLKQIKLGRPNKKQNDIQTLLTHKLYTDAGVEEGVGDLEKVSQFEEYLDCCITIVDSDCFNSVIYPDINSKDYKPKLFNIYLYKSGNHIDLINNTKVAGFFGKNYFCHNCKTTYGSKGKHKCNFKCNICCSTNCDCIGIKDFTKVGSWTNCCDCNRFFPSKTCFNNHITNKTCDKVWKCNCCKKVLDRNKHPPEKHKCGDYECKSCGQVVGKDHKCYLFPKPIKPFSEKYIFFDFEATQNTGKHEINLAVSQYYDSPTPIIHYDIDSFCSWLFDKKHKGFTILAHNGKGYDYQFIMKWIYTKSSYKPFVIYAGSKIMSFSIKEGLNIRFVDSVNFLAMRLEDFPSTFGIKELKKGFYPHLFNTKENENYIGEIPDEDDFCYNSFKEDKRIEFREWWADKVDNDYVWNNKKELLEYCISDVDILRRCMIKFRQLYIDIADIDPLQYTTIASVCMAIYKGHYIVENYNTDYKEAVLNDSLDFFKQSVIEQVFREKKIALFDYDDSKFIRQGFFGGRTNSIAIKYNFKEGETGRYADITSLYPTTNFYDEYGLGHLTKITDITREVRNKLINKEFTGFVKLDISPPTDLYLPVLPTKGEKLVFDLKRKTGIWATPELYTALDKGYKINEIFEIRYYSRTSNSLFKSYVSKFLKLKQESSGKPDWVKTDEDLDKYIKDYKDKQGILLDKSNIKKNKGLRAVSKLCLNSLWGKFGQRDNLPQTEITSSVKTFNNLMFSDRYTNQNIFFIDEDRVEIKYKTKESELPLSNTNIGIACFTTAHARTRLYQGLNKLNRQVLYFDTDSIVYKYNPNNKEHFELPIGDLLGEWTDELEGGKIVNTFLGAGPKNYSYETDDGVYHTKVKGFTLNYSASKKINHHTIFDIVDNYRKDKKDNYIEVDYFNIVRNKDKSLKSVIQPKKYSFVYNKRQICPENEFGDIMTLPFGYKK